jgi:hypothetical protein
MGSTNLLRVSGIGALFYRGRVQRSLEDPALALVEVFVRGLPP